MASRRFGSKARAPATAGLSPSLLSLPVPPTVAPMLAVRAGAVPRGEGWHYEPKWDGFRTVIFRAGPDLFVQSRDERPLDRYFPELAEPLLAALPERCVVDGEIVIAGAHGLEFETLQHRLHPAATRVAKLAAETPASVVLFDLLAEGERDLRSAPFSERRAELIARVGGARAPIHVTPATTDPDVAEDWFRRFEGAGLDGVMAKRGESTYQAGQRVMTKVKHERTCDAVVAGFRWHKDGKDERVGSLLLGLFDGAGELHHVGVTASFTDAKRRELKELLQPLRENALEGHPWASWAAHSQEETRKPGMTSRWNADKDLSWEPLRIERVVEVAYDHMQGSRFRHTAQFRRWRSDKRADECRFDQLEVTPPFELAEIFATR